MNHEQEEYFRKFDKDIFKNYRLTMAVGVAVCAGLLAFVMGISAKGAAFAALIGLVATEIETLYEIRRREWKKDY
jgi:hypothetical protein